MIDSSLHVSDWFLFFYFWFAISVGFILEDRDCKKTQRRYPTRR